MREPSPWPSPMRRTGEGIFLELPGGEGFVFDHRFYTAVLGLAFFGWLEAHRFFLAERDGGNAAARDAHRDIKIP